jgi:EF hand
MMMRLLFVMMDSDGDGTVSLQEFQAAHERIFKAMDANKDGVLTLQEIQEFMRGTRTPPVAAHSINEYNWSGFSCPYCSASNFVSCSGGHLACDGTAELRDGRRFRQCFCGQAGFITGTMNTVEGKRISAEADVVASPNSAVAESQSQSRSIDIALLPPTQGTPKVKG